MTGGELPPRRRRRQGTRRASSPDPNANLIGCCVILVSGIFLVLLYKTQEILDSIVTKSDFRISAKSILKRLTDKKAPMAARHTFSSRSKSKYPPPSDLRNPPSKFLIYDSDLAGQGTGNVVSGLLTAHLLAVEFGRIVCTEYPELLEAFEIAHPWVIDHCPGALRDVKDSDAAGGEIKRIFLINFEKAPNECHLKEVLSSDTKYIIMIGNTYPRYVSFFKTFPA
jgi:hypothetical protein